jgi:hypothetical protein
MSDDVERPTLTTLGDRVWWAWNALPRKAGKPPTWKSLERDFKIPLASFSKLVKNDRRSVDSETLPKLAAALHVSEAWLVRRDGPDPKPTGALLGREEGHSDVLDALVRKHAVAGGLGGEKPNPFQVAVLYHGSAIDADVIEAVANEARGREESRTALGWGRVLVERQRAKNEAKQAAKAAKKKPKAAAPPAAAKRRAAG